MPERPVPKQGQIRELTVRYLLSKSSVLGLTAATILGLSAPSLLAQPAGKAQPLTGAAKEQEPPRAQPKRGADIEMPLSLTFEEAITGLTTNLTVNRSEQCSRCNGAGDIGGADGSGATGGGTGTPGGADGGAGATGGAGAAGGAGATGP